MTLREYAAIHLKVPSSGADWLDDMIRQSLKNELAAKAMQALIGHKQLLDWPEDIADSAHFQADAMLKKEQA